jgi:hypothetical protein
VVVVHDGDVSAVGSMLMRMIGVNRVIVPHIPPKSDAVPHPAGTPETSCVSRST